MSTPSQKPRWYWCRHTNGDGTWSAGGGRRTAEGPPGADLAALRRGLGREPWSVPEMWRFYELTDPPRNLNRRYTDEQAAEHAALTLYAVHQQAQEHPMHRSGVGLGAAAVALRRQYGTVHPGGEPGRAKPDSATSGSRRGGDPEGIHPVDRRFGAAATATDLTELVLHLRGLVTQLRGIGQPLDYTQLYHDLCRWQDPGRAAQVRRQWGMQYFTRTEESLNNSSEDTTEAEETP